MGMSLESHSIKDQGQEQTGENLFELPFSPIAGDHMPKPGVQKLE